MSIARMRELVGDGAGWMVAEVIPDAVFIVVDADNGSLGVGGGQGALRAWRGARVCGAVCFRSRGVVPVGYS